MTESSLRASLEALAARSQIDQTLVGPLKLRGALIERLADTDVAVPELRLPADLVRAQLAAGTPLLDGTDLPVPAAAGLLFEQLAAIVQGDVETQAAAHVILAAVRSHRLHVEQVVGEAIVSHADHLDALAQNAGVDADLLATLADLTSRPLLTAVARRLQPALTLASWIQPWCPICGAHPILAELGGGRALDGFHFRCGRCTTTWAWDLPACPACRTGRLRLQAPASLGRAEVGSVAFCDACHTYLKVAARVQPDGLAHVLLYDLASWTDDRAALILDFSPFAQGAYRLEHGDLAGEEWDDD